MATEGWNVRLLSEDGSTHRNVGKVIPHQGQWVYHYWTKRSEKRRDLDAWGLREAVLAHLQQHGVRFLYLYDKEDTATWLISVKDALRYGSPGKTDEYGPTINVPGYRFAPVAPLSGYIPGSRFRIVHHDQRLQQDEEPAYYAEMRRLEERYR